MNSYQRNNTAAAKFPAVAVQPFGLTNLQSKIAGPLLTSTWRALRGWTADDAARELRTPVVGTSVALSAQQAREFLDSDTGRRRLRRLGRYPTNHHADDALVTYAPEAVTRAAQRLRDSEFGRDRLADAVLRAGTFEGAREHVKAEPSGSAAAQQPTLRFLATPPVWWIPFTPDAGFAYERAASVAMCGAELLFPAVSNVLITLVADDEALEHALRVNGLREKPEDYRRHGFVVSAYREGSRMALADERVKLSLLARALDRRLVLFARDRAAPAVVIDPPKGTEQPPVLLFENNVGIVNTDAGEPVYAPRAVSIARPTDPPVRLEVTPRRGAPAPRALPDEVFARVLACIDEGSIAHWFSRELPPCAFSLDCRTRIYHVEIPQSKIKSGQRLQALVEAPGFGLDAKASEYLRRSLPPKLIPLHVDADGHCLAHSLSRCLIGKEYLWHALRTAMKEYIVARRADFERFLSGHSVFAFLAEKDQMDEMIANADPDRDAHDAANGTSSPDVISLGLESQHIFAFANLLRRPIVLFDGDTAHRERYVFLPLLEPSCSTRAALAVGWWSREHMHYVPVVAESHRDVPVPLNEFTPMGPDDLPNVYGLEKAADKVAALDKYLRRRPESTRERPEWILEVGGSSFDAPASGAQSPRQGAASSASAIDEHLSRTLGEYVLALFYRQHRASLWCVHEVARAASVADSYEYDTIFTTPRISELAKQCLDQLRNGELRYCEKCTATCFMESSRACRVCRKQLRKGADGKIDLHTGTFPLSDGASIPIQADAEIVGVRDRLKEWVNNPPLEAHDAGGGASVRCPVGRIVFARESASGPAVAEVTASYRDPLTGKDVVDVRFLAVTNDRAAERYAVPFAEIQDGYPVDMRTTVEVTLGAFGRNEIAVVVDAHEKLCTNAEQLAADRGRELGLSDADVSALRDSLQQAIEELRAGGAADEGQRLQGTGTFTGSFIAPPPELAEGATLRWEAYDKAGQLWAPYDEFQTMQLESAFAQGHASATVDVAHYGHFTVEFDEMRQVSDHSANMRDVRRVELRPYSCEACTLDNPASNSRCEVCNTARPAHSMHVTHDAASVKEERLNRLLTDPALARGGKFYEASEGAAIRTFNRYRDTTFALVPTAERYYPIQEVITPRNPLYQHLEALERDAPVVRALPPFTIDVRLVRIGHVRFVRDRTAAGEFSNAFVASLNGRLLKTPNFLDFALGDSALHGREGELYREALGQREVTAGITLPSVYGPALYFMFSERSAFPTPLLVPVSKNIRRGNPLYDDIQRHYEARVRPVAGVSRRHVSHSAEFQFQGWRLCYNTRDDFFEALGTVASY